MGEGADGPDKGEGEVMDTVDKHVALLRTEIKSLRDWLDYLERDLNNDKGVISAIVITSISEICNEAGLQCRNRKRSCVRWL